MIGESQKENDLFYTCSLIEYIANSVMEKIITNILESNIKTNSEMFQVVNSFQSIHIYQQANILPYFWF